MGENKWTDKPVKTLGIYFGHDKEECEKFNWENKIPNFPTTVFRFTLSGLLFQINLKHLLSISFQIFLEQHKQ
jgi:hypothetical protein